MPALPFAELTSLDALEAALERARSEPIVIYKHSAICPISSRMQRQVAALDRAGDPPVYRVVVQDARDVSDAIAERLGVRHESPQALVVYDDAAIYDASHGRISADDLRTASSHPTHD